MVEFMNFLILSLGTYLQKGLLMSKLVICLSFLSRKKKFGVRFVLLLSILFSYLKLMYSGRIPLILYDSIESLKKKIFTLNILPSLLYLLLQS